MFREIPQSRFHWAPTAGDENKYIILLSKISSGSRVLGTIEPLAGDSGNQLSGRVDEITAERIRPRRHVPQAEFNKYPNRKMIRS